MPIPTIMKAALLQDYYAPLNIADVPVPKPADDEVLVEIEASGLCFTDVHIWKGEHAPPALPLIMGHEGVGRVVALGPNASRLKIGDRVGIGYVYGACGHCRDCLTGGENYCPDFDATGYSIQGCFAEYVCLRDQWANKIPDDITSVEAAPLMCAGAASYASIKKTGVHTGDTVAIFGMGGLGQYAVQIAKLMGLRVIAVDISDDKLRLAADLGATHTVNARQCDPVEAIRELTKGRGVDFAVEAAGRSDTIEQAFAAVRREGGLCVFASHPEAGARITLDPFELICGKRISGTWGGASNPDRDVPLFADLYREGKLPLERLISHRYALEDINEALEDLEQHRTSRPLIEIDPSLANGS